MVGSGYDRGHTTLDISQYWRHSSGGGLVHLCVFWASKNCLMERGLKMGLFWDHANQWLDILVVSCLGNQHLGGFSTPKREPFDTWWWQRLRKTKTYSTSWSGSLEQHWMGTESNIFMVSGRPGVGLGWVGWDQNKDIGIVPVPRVITTVAQQPIRKKTSIHSVISFKPSQTGRTNFEMRVWWQNYTDNLC